MLRTNFKSFSIKTMTYSLAFMLVACPVVQASQALAAPVSSSVQSTMSATAAHAPVKYRIDARLDEHSMRIQASETVTYWNTSNDMLQEIVFHTFADANRSTDTQTSMFEINNAEIQKENLQKKSEDFLGGIDIHSATAQGQALDFSDSNQALTVELKQELKPGEAVTVEIGFEVKIPYGMQRLSYYKDIINGAHWFPVMSVYDEEQHAWNKTPYSEAFETDYYDSSDFEVHFNVPEAYQMLLPGNITTQTDPAEPGRKIVTAIADNTRELVFFASSNYKVESVTRDGLKVEYYYFDNMPDKKKLVDEYIDTAFKAIQFFNELNGSPFI